MTDDELVERLRRSLEMEAAAITPGPPGEQPAAGYPAAGPLPRMRARWPLAVAAAVVAAAVGLAVAYWPGGGSSSHIGIVSPGPSTSAPTSTPAPSSPVPTTRPTAATVAPGTGAPATAVPSPAVSAIPATTVPAAAQVPAGFAPLSVTFVSAHQGWVAGAAPCGSRSCLTLARTLDGGRTWDPAPAPPLTVTNEVDATRGVTVRFGNASDGWIYMRQPASLWSTHDGGASWHRVAVPALTAQATIMAMEVAAGRVQLAVIPDSSSTIHLEVSPVSSDRFADSDSGVSIGAGPVPTTQLVLQKSQGWLLEGDRTVVGGARLNGSASWTNWTPPCQTGNGPATLAASTPTDLVAVCLEGEWGPARNLPAGSRTPSAWLFRSSNGGAGFEPVGPLPGQIEAAMVASPAPSTVVVGGAAPGLTASFDGGHSWQTVYRSEQVQTWSYLGFTTLTQGVAIGSGAGGTSLLAMTRDGGHTWTAVSFGTGG
jgi:photosystem II stability/assembly factor-like uncharacterized protein